MKCSRCGQENAPAAKFCERCAAPLSHRCGRCGAEVGAAARFCSSCGHPVELAPATPARFGAPAQYTPRNLVERILTSKTSLEGERKQVTVLFADVKSSMELLAHRDPEDARRILDPVLEWMMEAVHRYEGTVNQVMGDGIMALFGAPIAHEDHAVRACYAALRMLEHVAQGAAELPRVPDVPIQIRVGLNSGEVVVRSIGSDLHMDYTAVGQTTHLAARLEQMAAPGTALISPETRRLAEGYVEAKRLGARTVRGVEQPLEVYELVAASPVGSRFQAVAARGVTRFVGRDAEMERLHQSLEDAGAGHGQVVAVVGDPGIGKSRLCWELTHSERAGRWRVIGTGAVSYGKATSYLPVVGLLRAYFGVAARDDGRWVRTKVTETLLALDPQLQPVLPAVLWLLDLPVDDPDWQRLDPPQRRQQVLEGLKRLLLRESRVQPLLLVFEDLQWIDTETQAFLDGLIDALPAARLLLLVNYRPEYQDPWRGKAWYRQIRVAPLPRPGAEALLDVLLGTSDELRELKQLLIERTEGNPFFLEESVRTLVETDVLVGTPGAYRPGTPRGRADLRLPLPASVQAVLAARIDRLAPEHKRVLQAASVVGPGVPLVILEAIADEPEGQLREALDQLVAAQFLDESRRSRDVEYTFKHALTHEVAYGSLLHERRRALHGRVVEAIEARAPHRLDEQIEWLAHHAVRGEQWTQAVRYLRQAGIKAYRRSANRDAVALFEQALHALAHLPETPGTTELAIDVRFDLRNALQPLGDLPRILECLKTAEELAEHQGDERRLGWVASYLTEHYRMLGEPDLAAAAGRRALDIGDRRADLAMQVVTRLPLGLLYRTRGEYRRAMEFLGWNIAHLEGRLLHERFGLFGLASVFSRSFLVMCLAELGEFPEAIRLGEDAVRIAEEADHPVSRVYAGLGLATVHLRKGELARAINVLGESVELARATQIPVGFVYSGALLGYALVGAGRVADGLPLLEEALAVGRTLKLNAGRPGAMVFLAEAYLRDGRVSAAAATAEDALRLAIQQGERGNEAYARRIRAEVAVARGEFSAAIARFEEALALAAELEMRPLLARGHADLARGLQRTAQDARAGEHAAAAHSLFRALDMQGWSEHRTAAHD